MIKSISLSNQIGYDISLVLEDPYETGIVVKDITGLGYPKVNVQSMSIPSSDISLYHSSKMQTRNIVLTLLIMGGNESVEMCRRRLYNVLTVGMRIYFEIITDEKSVYTNGYVESVEPDIFSEEEQIQVSLICPDPLFYTGGKVEYVYDKNIGVKNLQFSKNQYDNWFDLRGSFMAKKPVSNLETLKEIFKIVSKYNQPKGFTLEIQKTEGSDGFNEIVITYENGSIEIKGNTVIDLYEDNVESNYFYNHKLIIKNDITGQKIIRSPIFFGSEVDITNDVNVVVYGDYPTLFFGENRFDIKTKAIKKVETTRPYIKNGESTNGDLMNGYNNGMWSPLNIEQRSEFILMDIYVNANNFDQTYYKIKDPSIKKEEKTFICQLKLTATALPQNYSDDADHSYKYRFFDYVNDKWYFGIKIYKAIGTDKPTYNPDFNNGWVKSVNDWYTIACATCRNIDLTGSDNFPPMPKSKKILVTITKTNINSDLVYSFLYGCFPSNVSGLKHQATCYYTYYVEKNNPDNDIYYESIYGQNFDFNFRIEHDETIEGL